MNNLTPQPEKSNSSSIDNKAQKEFLTKRNIAFGIVFVIVLILISVFTSIFFLGINFNTFSELSSSNSLDSQKIGFLFGLIIGFFYQWIWNSFYIFFNSRSFGVRANIFDWIVYGITNILINSITPFSLGSEPYKIYWLRRHGLSSRDALLVVSSTSVYFTATQIIVTWPSFIIVSTHYDVISSSSDGLIAYWFSFGGMMLDILVFSIFFSMSYSRHVHVLLGRIFNRFLKLIKKPYKTKEQLIEEFQTNASFKKAYIQEMKKWKHVIVQAVGTCGLALFQYFSVYFSIQLLQTPVAYCYGVDVVFNIANVAVSANNFIPIPGGEGTIQFVLQKFFLAWDPNNLTPESQDLNKAIFVWRCFQFYLPVVVGLLFFPYVLINHIKKEKKLKLSKKI